MKKLLIFMIALSLIALSACSYGTKKELDSSDSKNNTADQPTVQLISSSNQNANSNDVNDLIPSITDITYSERNSAAPIHQYELIAWSKYEDGLFSEDLYYDWGTDCGYFWENENLGTEVSEKKVSIIWRYGADNECLDANITVKAYPKNNKINESNSFTKKIFNWLQYEEE